jgi:signal transduction histidine kinase
MSSILSSEQPQVGLRLMARLISLVVVVIAIAALAGWFAGSRTLNAIRPGYIPMAPNTALSFILLGGALAVLDDGRRASARFAQGAAAVVLVITSARFAEYATGADIRVDHWLFRFPSGSVGLAPVGKMALFTSLTFILSAMGLLFLTFPDRRVVTHLGLLTGMTAGFLGLVFLLGYVYGAPLLYRGESIPMALNTAACFLGLGGGVVLRASAYSLSDRREAKEAARLAQEALEQRVIERTAELVLAIEELQAEVTTRRAAEDKVRKLNQELEERVLRRTAELETANRDLETFSYTVSHDLRAPLRGMRGFSQILLEEYRDRLDPQAKHYLEQIDDAGQQMAELIESLLALGRASHEEVRKERIDLSEMAGEIVQELRLTHPGRVVQAEVAEDLTAEADPRLLRTALANLLGNAWKFTSRRTDARIKVGMKKCNGECCYFVRDNGVGFNMADAQKLFTPFQRLHAEREFYGTGIGLVTVRRIIERHGGRVWAEGEPGAGATFYFTLSL